MSDNKLPPEPSMDEILASIRRILAEDYHTVTRSPPRLRGNTDVFDLTEAINDDGSTRHIAPISVVVPEAPPRKLPDGRIEPVPPRPADAATDPAGQPRLVSHAASEAVAASFARLAGVSRRDGGEPALDDLVRETLRPMLQAWLDAHLPELVERLVRAEIARVVGAIKPSAP
jgi:cell pole-organizing protein PopZ